jgi:hypothetical protein
MAARWRVVARCRLRNSILRVLLRTSRKYRALAAYVASRVAGSPYLSVWLLVGVKDGRA